MSGPERDEEQPAEAGAVRRRDVLALGLAPGLAVPALASAAAAAEGTPARKILRVAFTTSETSFDPAKIVDLYSRVVTAHIFESLYEYDPLARPAKVRPLTADGYPQSSDDFRTWTVKLKPGIFFPDDPAFKGKPRELVAEDYAYMFKRVVDPANASPILAGVLDFNFLGLNALRDEAVKNKTRFDYDRPVEGLKALDRHTLQMTLGQPRPRFLESLASPDLFGAVAREAVEFYGDRFTDHPIGTGPFRLKQWRRSSYIVLERNPAYREVRYHAEPTDDEGRAIAAKLQGRRLPIVDEVQISVIEEDQPRWLAFLNHELDALAGQGGALPGDYANIAMPNGKLAPNLARRGIQALPNLNADIRLLFFNMDDPLVGGYTPEKVALRRAIGLAWDTEAEIRLVLRGQGIVAQSTIVPHTTGYDPAYKSENGDYDPARAKALLDLYGYADKDGDGWRELPDGKPLVLQMASTSDQRARQVNELMRKWLAAVGLRVEFRTNQWPENLKNARAGKLMMWQLGFSSAQLDGWGALARLYGPQAGSQNLSYFKLAAFDRIYERLAQMPDGPERLALFTQAKNLAVAYMPYKDRIHRIETDLLHPWVSGYRRPLFWQEWWHRVDVDASAQQAALDKGR